jgi:tRNA G46 methylase TrmB
MEWFQYDKKSVSVESIISNRKVLLDTISSFLNSNPEIAAICEIGVGDGRFLEHMKKKYKNIKAFVGVDLNSELIEKTKSILITS